MFQNLFAQTATKIFLQTENKRYSYQWLQEKIKKISGFFESLDIRQGDRILLAVSDECEMSALFLAALANGITTVIADPESKEPRAASIIRRTNPKCLIADSLTLKSWKISSGNQMTVLSYQKDAASAAGLLSNSCKNESRTSTNDYPTLPNNVTPTTRLNQRLHLTVCIYFHFRYHG
jgi:acyl-coenzyme A synthetase/AMP-(fatty) acid ligase